MIILELFLFIALVLVLIGFLFDLHILIRLCEIIGTIIFLLLILSVLF